MNSSLEERKLMDKLIAEVKGAAANLKAVATNLHVQLDTSQFSKAVDALIAAVKKPVKEAKEVPAVEAKDDTKD